MDKPLEIRLSKCTLMIYENELMKMLAAHPDIFAKASGRGKAAQRATSAARRQSQGFGSWELLKEMKSNHLDPLVLQWVKGMDPDELREAVKMFIDCKAKAFR